MPPGFGIAATATQAISDPSDARAFAAMRPSAGVFPTTSPGVGPAPSGLDRVRAGATPDHAPSGPALAPAPGPGAAPNYASAPAPGPNPNASATGPTASESPWARPNNLIPPGKVSPYAPTVPQETYKPSPGDPIYSAKRDETAAGLAPPIVSMDAKLPNAPHRSPWPIVLIAVGVIALVVVIVIWLLYA